MKSDNSKGEIWMLTDRHQVPDLVKACLNAATQVSTILIREKDWSFDETAGFCHGLSGALHPAASKPQLILNWNGRFDPTDLPIQGLHLGFDLASTLVTARPECLPLFQKKKPLWKIGASLHSEKEWEAIRSLPLDYVLLSNVFMTSCKPGKEGLGLEGTEKLFKGIQRERPALQAYGLGGLKTSDLEKITALGLQGIALRSAFF